MDKVMEGGRTDVPKVGLKLWHPTQESGYQT